MSEVFNLIAELSDEQIHRACREFIERGFENKGTKVTCTDVKITKVSHAGGRLTYKAKGVVKAITSSKKTTNPAHYQEGTTRGSDTGSGPNSICESH